MVQCKSLARDRFFQTPFRYLSRFTLVNDFSVGSLACGKHLVQALPTVFALQCLTGKADQNKQQQKHKQNIM